GEEAGGRSVIEQVLQRNPVYLDFEFRHVIDEEIRSLCQEVFQRLSRRRLESGIRTRVVVCDVDDREENGFAGRYCAGTHGCASTRACEKPHRPRLSDITVLPCRIEYGVLSERDREYPLPPRRTPLCVRQP